MSDEARRLIQSLLGSFPPALGETCWRPPADVYREGQDWLVKVDLAGVRPDEIEVRISGRVLQISGTRRDPLARVGWQAYRLEIAYNRFERRIEFPCELADAAVEYRCQDGMLLVEIRCGGGAGPR